MKRYETVVIVDPDLAEEDRNALVDRVRELIEREKGFLVEIDEWGGRKLAYPINKKPRGHYYRLDYCGGGPLIHEMERSFRIDDRVMKFLTVLLEEQVDIEKIQAEIAQAAAEREAAETPAETETASETEASEKKQPAEAAAEETTETPKTQAAETETPAPETEASEKELPAEPAAEEATEAPKTQAADAEASGAETEAQKEEE